MAVGLTSRMTPRRRCANPNLYLYDCKLIFLMDRGTSVQYHEYVTESARLAVFMGLELLALNLGRAGRLDIAV